MKTQYQEPWKAGGGLYFSAVAYSFGLQLHRPILTKFESINNDICCDNILQNCTASVVSVGGWIAFVWMDASIFTLVSRGDLEISGDISALRAELHNV
jgi:hypothetical protein